MTNRIPRIYRDTKKVFSTRWSAAELYVPAWVVNSMIYITVLRSVSYGLELVILGTGASINPLLGFAAILGVHTWGVLMLVGVAVLLIGLWTKNSLIVTVGTLLCGAVWAGFGIVLCIGWASLGDGGRFAVAALATAATWIVFFVIQLKTLSRNGVES